MKELSTIEPALDKEFKMLGDLFQESLNGRNVEVLVNSGGWANNNGVAMGWLSCPSKDIDGESFDLTFDLRFHDKRAYFQCGIYLSDGCLVEELEDLEIESIDDYDDLIAGMVKCRDKIREKILPTYLMRLIEHLKEF